MANAKLSMLSSARHDLGTLQLHPRHIVRKSADLRSKITQSLQGKLLSCFGFGTQDAFSCCGVVALSSAGWRFLEAPSRGCLFFIPWILLFLYSKSSLLRDSR